MKTTPTLGRSWIVFVCFFTAALTNAQTPAVTKVAPPNWWIGLPNPMILITGEGLSAAALESETPKLLVTQVRREPSGHYLFAWLDTHEAMPGTARLRVRTAACSIPIALSLQKRNQSADGFAGFNQDDVIYLIMPDRFADGNPGNDQPPDSKGTYNRLQPTAYHGGDLRGIDEHLDYLKTLGVTTLWLTPIWKNANSDYHGYHVVDLYATDEHMGSLQDYKNLVVHAHQRGMKVLMDYVVNHTGPEHPWVANPPSPTWFNGTPDDHLDAVTNFSALTDPHATWSEKRGVLQGWFVNKLPDLNTDDPLVSQYLLENAVWWIESTHLDGLRLDTFPYSSRRFWSKWLTELRKSYPRVNSIGEVSDHDVTIASFFDGGKTQFDGIDSQVSTIFDYPLYYALRDVLLHGKPMQQIAGVLQHDWLYAHPEMLVTFIGNHDTSRFAGEPGSSKGKLKAAFSLLLTLRGIPQIYYGDEIGMQGAGDPDNRRDFPGGFPADSHDAFTTMGRSPDQQEIFAHVQTLLRLRQAHSALREGKQWDISSDDSYFAFARESAQERVLIVFNNSEMARSVTFSLSATPLENVGELEVIFGGGKAEIKDHAAAISMPAIGVSVFQAK